MRHLSTTLAPERPGRGPRGTPSPGDAVSASGAASAARTRPRAWVCVPGRLLACATFPRPTSRCTRCAWAATCSAGRPTRPSPSPSSTPTRRPAATSSTPPTATRNGCPATAAASRRRSSGAGWRRAATATRSSSPPRSARRPTARGWRPTTCAPRPRSRCSRLQTDRIDLLYTHRDDEVTAPEETLGALDELVREGKVRHVAASNVSPERLEAAMAASAREGLARYVALQPHYNLVERGYENGLADVCRRHDLGCLPYFALAKGFLTGKYRAGRRRRRQPARARAPAPTSTSAASACSRPSTRWPAAHDVPVAAVSLAWLAAQPTVVAPIASARTPAAAGRADGDGRPRAERRRAAGARRGRGRIAGVTPGHLRCSEQHAPHRTARPAARRRPRDRSGRRPGRGPRGVLGSGGDRHRKRRPDGRRHLRGWSRRARMDCAGGRRRDAPHRDARRRRAAVAGGPAASRHARGPRPAGRRRAGWTGRRGVGGGHTRRAPERGHRRGRGRGSAGRGPPLRRRRRLRRLPAPGSPALRGDSAGLPRRPGARAGAAAGRAARHRVGRLRGAAHRG